MPNPKRPSDRCLYRRQPNSLPLSRDSALNGAKRSRDRSTCCFSSDTHVFGLALPIRVLTRLKVAMYPLISMGRIRQKTRIYLPQCYLVRASSQDTEKTTPAVTLPLRGNDKMTHAGTAGFALPVGVLARLQGLLRSRLHSKK